MNMLVPFIAGLLTVRGIIRLYDYVANPPRDLNALFDGVGLLIGGITCLIITFGGHLS